MFLTDLKTDDYIIDTVKEIKIIFDDDVAVILKGITCFDLDFDRIEYAFLNFTSSFYSKKIHEYYNKRQKIKRVVLKLNVLENNSNYNEKNVEIHYDSCALIRKLRYIYDRELGNYTMEFCMEGTFNG